MPRATGLIPAGARRRIAAVLLAALAGPVAAQEIELRGESGETVVSGVLLGSDGTFLRLRTQVGEVLVDAARLTCVGDACPVAGAPQVIRISGAAGPMRDLLPPLIETFARRTGLTLDGGAVEGVEREFTLSRDGTVLARISLHAGSSREGFADLIADAADLVVSTREIRGAEAGMAVEAGRGDLRRAGRSAILALDALVPVVSVGNSLETVDMALLRRVLSGEITDWSQMGVGSGPIALHLPGPITGAGDDLARLAGGSLATGAILHEDPAAAAAAVAGDPLALGVVPYSARGSAEAVAIGGPCGLIATPGPVPFKTEDFALTAPVFLYAPARPLPSVARDFVDYATSPAAQSVIRRAGYVDQFPEAIGIGAQGERLAHAIVSAGNGTSLGDLQRLAGQMLEYRRLTPTFRFEDGTADLDAQSRSNVELLAEAIERGLFDGRRIVFAGFSDGLGNARRNRALSRERAEAVRDAVLGVIGAGHPMAGSLAVQAHGEALPLACDDAVWGRRINRRVEVWLG